MVQRVSGRKEAEEMDTKQLNALGEARREWVFQERRGRRRG